MFRKSGKKTRDAIRAGGGGNRNVWAEGRGGDSSGSTASVAPSCLPAIGDVRSPFITPRAGNSGNAVDEPGRSFYCNPLNGWHDHAEQGNDFPQQHHIHVDADEIITNDVERILREIVICCAIFIAGTVLTEHAPLAYHVLEVFLVAWATTLFIMIMERRRMVRITAPPSATLMRNVGQTTLGSKRMESMENPTPMLSNKLQEEEQASFRKKRSRHEIDHDEPPSTKAPPALTVESTVSSASKRQNQYLEPLYVMMVGRQERIIPNCTTYDIDTDLFSGKMLLMFRTPDVDELTKSNDPVVNYFRGKQRRFEFQWQLRLKKIPSGDLFLGVEVDEPIQMGMIQRALANTALKFTKKMNQGFSYSFSDSLDRPSFLSFPVGTSMDRFNATKIGDQLPILGQEITEDPETIKQRKKGMKIQWNTDSVYTMALWSAYADWSEWQVLNFPGIRPFSISSLVGGQPIKLTLYTQQNLERQAPIPSSHTTSAVPLPPRDIIFTIEVSHATFTTMGCEAQKWMSRNALVKEKTAEENDFVVFSEIDSLNRNESFSEDYELDEQFYGDDRYEGDLVDELDDPETSCYLLSGTSVSLREGDGRYVASGGGYAVLQSGRASIVFEKVQPKSKKNTPCSSTVIVRSGDVVRVQLVDVASKAVKFLAIHRGWWLRWSSVRPKRNGLFTIHTCEPIGSPVLLDLPFSLNSLRWSHYSVGACLDTSVKYGGRMLGILKTGRVSGSDDVGCGEEDDGEIRAEVDVPDKRMMPLLLRAESWDCFSRQSPSKVLAQESAINFRNDVIPTPIHEAPPSPKHYDVDIPVWLEIINRTKRTMQLVYGVRLKESNSGSDTNSSQMTLKLLTGRALAPVLQLAVEQISVFPPSPDKWQKRFECDNRDEVNDADSYLSSSDDSDSDEEEEEDDDDQDDLNNRQFFIAGPNHVSVDHVHDTEVNGSDHESKSVVEHGNAGSSKTSGDAETSVDVTRRDCIELQADTKCMAGQNDIDKQGTTETRKKNRVNHAAVIGRVAKTVKESTVITGKHVIKQSKNITKGTVNVGRAAGRAIPVSSVVYSKPPRKHEPGGRVHGRRADKSHMKMIDRAIKHIESAGKISNSLLSGMLLPPDQSCRKMSHILLNLCDIPSIQDSIAMLAATNSTEDVAFLRGSAAELGVKPLYPVDSTFDIDCLVARCIYEGHWREELCVLHTKEQYIAFYAPLSKKPSVAVSFEEIMAARACDDGSGRCPLPGLFVVAIDTTWKCHYLAFLDAKQRETFLVRLNEALFHAINESDPSHSRQVPLPEFESYRMSLETSLTGTAGKWRAVSTGKNSKHKKQRRVLNGRRTTFDLEPIVGKGENPQEEVASYVENLLKMALSFSPDKLDALESRFIEFLDQASRLRTLPLQDIDFSSKEAFCIFVNLYHLLLQHSLLLAVDGLPTVRSVKHFKRCSCYEIGDEVFSLAELECCVIRGNTSRPAYIKPPFVDAPKKSRPYLIYGLGSTDFRINFILNPGDKSYPSEVPVLQKGRLDDQLDTASAYFLTSQVQIDKRKRTVFLPKACDVYALDFGMGDGLVCLSQCLKYLDESSQTAIADLLENGVVSVKFNCVSDHFHPSLTELLC